MSRVLLLAMGVPSFVPWARHAGPGLRASHFAKALALAGHDVFVVAVVGEGETAPDATGSEIPVAFVTEKRLFDEALRRRLDAFAPDAVVGVTAYAASLAARLRLDAPLWADVFGDLMAEAQAKAARSGSDWSIVHFWTLMRGVLESADRFSAVSGAQAHALVGQLGLAGRLSARTAGEDLVAVIPCAAEAPAASADRAKARAALGLPSDAFVLLSSGGVNTWCDVDTLAAGVADAMRRDPRVHLLVTGGAIPGHDEESMPRLLRGLAAADATRVHLLGWIDSCRLPAVYAAADLGLHVEEKLYERELGAENRVVEWLAHGLPLATTALSETGRELVREGLAIAVKPGDAGDLAEAILRAAASPEERHETARRGAQWAASARGLEDTAAPLLRWCAAPRAARDRDGARLVRLGLLSHPETSVEMLEAYVAALPLREVARRGTRWVLRRALSAARGAAATIAKALGRRPSRASDVAKATLPALLVLASLATGGCAKDALRAPARRPNILLLSIDTLRADHLGAYGYAVTPSPTPWMDRLAAGGVVFEQAVSSAPETAPALATLVTGLYQDRHGVMYNRAKLSDSSRTLAERLKEAGYDTASFVANWLVDSEHGFAQGFDRAEVLTNAPGAAGSLDDRLVSRAGDFLRSTTPDRPWFAWVHMIDPHGPYNSAPPWWSKGFDYAKAPLAHDGEYPVSDSNFGLGVIPLYQKLDDAKRLSDYVRRYDGDIRYTDAQVGALLGAIAATGDLANTVVVLVADHGESLDEHGELLQHGWFVHDTTIRVPLVVSWPARLAPARVREQACSIDLVPTVLDLAGVAADPADFDGRSLAPELGLGARPAMTGPGAEFRAAGCFAIGPRANHPFALRTARYKMVQTPAGAPVDPRAPKDEASQEPERIAVYDLFEDPGETGDIQAHRGELVDQLHPSVVALRMRFRANGWRW